MRKPVTVMPRVCLCVKHEKLRLVSKGDFYIHEISPASEYSKKHDVCSVGRCTEDAAFTIILGMVGELPEDIT